MNNHKKEDIKFLKVISNYQLNEIPSLIKNIIIVKKKKKSQIFGLKKAYSNQKRTNQIKNFL